MFKYKNNNDVFLFFIEDENNNRSSLSNLELYYDKYISVISILKELIDNGNADVKDDAFVVSVEEILKLEVLDLQILGLPNFCEKILCVENRGLLPSNSLKFIYNFYNFYPNGTLYPFKRKGCIVEIESNEFLLTLKQFETCERIDFFNSLSEKEKGKVENLIFLSQLKKGSERDVEFCSFLKKQELYLPQKIKLNLDGNAERLEVIPTVEDVEESEFKRVFDRNASVQGLYLISGENNRSTRVLFDEQKVESLKVIKNNRNIESSSEIRKIVENPEYYFNEDEVDFSVFYSDRVKEIGVYNPKYYPFVCPYKSEWIPGIVSRDRVEGEKRIHFTSEEKLEEFKKAKNNAVENGEKSFIWENMQLDVEDSNAFIEVAKKQFSDTSKPIDLKKEGGNTEVLIIKENAELMEFSAYENLPEELLHRFSPIKNLSEGIILKEHQEEGVAWLQSLFKQDLSGGLLADDMGLGKTLQILYFLEWHSQSFETEKPYLIVAPVSLLENWEAEYDKFFHVKTLKISKLYGSEISLEKNNVPSKNKSDAKALQKKQIILTNYETLRRYQISLGLVDFSIVVLDEAQKIKTPGTLITNACKALKADFKIAMTGTPVENSLVDLWCIMDFAMPGLLGNAKDFAEEFQKPLEEEKTDIKELSEKLRYKINYFLKRRLKVDVAKDLPTKNDNLLKKVVMPNEQLKRYLEVVSEASNEQLEGIEKRNQILKSVWAIREISDHPYLYDKTIKNYETTELISSSAKLMTLVQLLEDIKNKEDKVIVFADRKETQKMLQSVVYDCYAIMPSIINGDTPSSKGQHNKSKFSRQQTIDYFQEKIGFNVIIMSPLAAGVGLNVVGANHVIHYSRHWNPAKEEQATDRAYRIGQKKDVNVYYPMAIFPNDRIDSEGNRLKSFDEVLDDLLSYKKALATNTLFPTEQAEVKLDEIFSKAFTIN